MSVHIFFVYHQNSLSSPDEQKLKIEKIFFFTWKAEDGEINGVGKGTGDICK
jgi:hypothetical protein